MTGHLSWLATALAAAALAAATLALPGAAAAQVVANPGVFTVTVTGLTMHVGGRSFTHSGAPTQLTNDAGIAADGTIEVPQTGGVSLPDVSFPIGSSDTAAVTFNPTAGATGTINPMTGAGSLEIQGYMGISDADGALGPDCTDGSSSAPITLSLTTGTTAPPPPAAPITGLAYNVTTGKFGLVSNTFALPAVTNCNGYEGAIDGYLGLPATPGTDSIVAAGSINPAVEPAVRAVLSAMPATGMAPLTVTLDARASTASAGIASYAFDPTGSGAFGPGTSTASTTYTYARPGTYRAAVRVLDTQGDGGTATRIIVVTPAPRRRTPPPRIRLPGARVCVDHRLTIRITVPRPVRLTAATVWIGGRRVLSRAHPRSPLVVTKLPNGRFTVEVLVRTSSGGTATASRRYRRCR